MNRAAQVFLPKPNTWTASFSARLEAEADGTDGSNSLAGTRGGLGGGGESARRNAAAAGGGCSNPATDGVYVYVWDAGSKRVHKASEQKGGLSGSVVNCGGRSLCFVSLAAFGSDHEYELLTYLHVWFLGQPRRKLHHDLDYLCGTEVLSANRGNRLFCIHKSRMPVVYVQPVKPVILQRVAWGRRSLARTYSRHHRPNNGTKRSGCNFGLCRFLKLSRIFLGSEHAAVQSCHRYANLVVVVGVTR